MGIPLTKNGMNAMECVSAMQKSIRRSLEREAMEFAVELAQTSRGFSTMVCNRLEIISHEDIDCLACPEIVPFVNAACEMAKRHYNAEDLGRWAMPIGNAIRLMSRAPKNREGDWFQAAVVLNASLNGYQPTIPDFAKDKHTFAGKRMGRGTQHFIDDGQILVPEAPKSVYKKEAETLWLQQDDPKTTSKSIKNLSKKKEAGGKMLWDDD